MDLTLIDQYGLPIAMLIGFSYYIVQRTVFLEQKLSKQIESDINRLESILIKLIDQIKLNQLETKEIKGYIEGIEHILAKLTGNGLKEKE